MSAVAGRDHPFELDDFQRKSIESIDRGHSVVVAAPTGSGKTVVAEHAVEVARRRGRKAFYTTPIKALSNQKFRDLRARYGADDVGLLTGDNTVNGDAPIVVMTTEVLRNMLYAASPTLRGLAHVVVDEVHYLEDRYRGPVWEEVIIHLPREVALVCLSATVSNAEELVEWISTVRGPTDLVLERTRPVTLENLYLVGERQSGRLHLLPTLVNGRPNERGDSFDVDVRRGRREQSGRRRRRWRTPARSATVELLAGRDMLPAIWFLFSRAGCDDAARGCLRDGVQLTTASEQRRIDEIVGHHLEDLSAADLRVLDHDRWMACLQAGLAAHHAGMVPPFKEAVEACFNEGLIKVVFATETLALGINMPARTVIIERLTKFTGETHEFLTPGQYTQLTGRAGRRGIDDLGRAIVLWSPWVPFRQVAALARSREFVLRSAFRPTYNMAANLVRRHTPEEAHALLNSSFAQFQADREVVRLERVAHEHRQEAAGLRTELEAMLGPDERWQDLLQREEPAERRRRRSQVEEVVRSLAPGDIAELASHGPVAVLSVAQRGPFSRLRFVDPDGDVGAVRSTALDEPPTLSGRIELPTPFAPRDPAFQRQVARELQHAVRASGVDSRPPPSDAPRPQTRTPLRTLTKTARRIHWLENEAAEAERHVGEGPGTLARQFDRVLQVLEALGYLEGWSLTDRGAALARLYHECDLLVAEAVGRGLLDGLDPPSLAGLVSCFTYEHRSPEAPPAVWFPSGRVERRYRSIVELGHEIRALEEAAALPATRLPDPTFLPLAHAWAAGGPLDDVLGDEDLSGGDFVRNVKQLVDLLRQVATVAPDPETRERARDAAESLRRGLVLASSVVDGGEDEDADLPW